MKQLRNIDSLLRKAYEPLTIEKSFKAAWSAVITNKAANPPCTPYTLCLPPPNITGSLHLGHAFTVAIEDSLIRWHYKRGHSALWIPGCDHASIATQVAVEKHLIKTMNKSRLDIGRDKFVIHVKDWKHNRELEIRNQLEKMGSLLDWSRYRFTMDDGYSRAVNEAFFRLHKSGLIHRKLSFVNWCPHLKSTISDIEVESVEIDGPTEISLPSHYKGKVAFGRLYTVRYLLERGKFISVSTTRPETILGDVALAVHPSDNRYSSMIGSYAHHPFFPERKLKIIADEGVDPNFGTGVVKVTPAHDVLDYEIWQRARLGSETLIDIFDDNAVIRPGFGTFSGLPRYSAREKVLSLLGQMGHIESIVSHKQILPICSRSGDVVEPRMRHQWFVTCKGRLVERAIKAAETGELTFIPDFYKNVWLHWLTNIKDWCISRQLWWGHRIPAFRLANQKGSDDGWVVARSEQEALKLLGADESTSLEQDEDVLDTWFSSGLYPLAAQGWPEITPELSHRYPLSIMETGADILFFWVARMVMLCSELAPNQGQLPFKKVLLHGIVRDATGKKMSKSLGNVIDPLDAINGATLQNLQSRFSGQADANLRTAQARLYPKGIPECGADGLRMALCLYDTHATDINIDVGHLAASRRFGNKLWQAVRFVLMHTPPDYKYAVNLLKEAKSNKNFHAMDGWLLGRLNAMKMTCHAAFSDEPVTIMARTKVKHLSPLRIHAAATSIRNFVHHDLCDNYIEYVKADLKSIDNNERNKLVFDILYSALLDSFDYLHPFMPFITEELSRVVRQEVGLPPVRSLLEVQVDKPVDDDYFSELSASVNSALDCIYASRSAITMTANAINQSKNTNKITKPCYSIEVPETLSILELLVKRLLNNVEVKRPDSKSNFVKLPVHSELQNVKLTLEKDAAILLLNELRRKAVKAAQAKQKAAEKNNEGLTLSTIDELHVKWHSLLDAQFTSTGGLEN